MAKLRKQISGSGGVMKRRDADLDLDDEPAFDIEQVWTVKPLGNGIYPFLKRKMKDMFPRVLEGHAKLDPKISSNTLEACYSSLIQGIIDIEENGELDLDQIDEKGFLLAVLERGSRALARRYARDLAKSLQDEYDPRDHRSRIAVEHADDIPVNRKSLPAPASESAARGGSDENDGKSFLGGFSIHIPNSLPRQRSGRVLGADHKD